MWSKISLRLRLTILACTILIAICTCLTTVSVLNAGYLFFKPIEFMSLQSTVPMPVIPNSGVAEELAQENTSPTEADVFNMFEDSKRGFTLQSVIFMVTITAVGTLLTWIAAGKALKPVTQLSNIIENIDENNLSAKIPVPKSQDEVARLTNSFNSMLTKINLAFESQKRFSQNAAHELKTPLSAILANIEVMEIDEDTASVEEYKETLLTVKQDVERMNVLVTDLLSLNVSEKNMDNSRFSTRELFSAILIDNNNNAQKKNISIIISGETELNGNRFMLERAFSNIIQNAIRYNRDNGEVVIHCSESSVTISDTGIGISHDKLPHIFEPFYCVDASRSRMLGGSGLGLAITKEIFDKYNIKMYVESDVGKGTTIRVTNL